MYGVKVYSNEHPLVSCEMVWGIQEYTPVLTTYTLKRWKTQYNCTFVCSLLMINQIVSLRGVDIGIFIIVARTGGLALFPGPPPQFCHLQYGKSGEGLDNISCQ